MTSLRLKLRDASCPIVITEESADWSRALAALLPNKRLIVVTSPRVARYCQVVLRIGLRKISYDTVLIPDGEPRKNLDTVRRAYGELVRRGADRSTHLLLLGGGVVGDMGGFVAATFLRGLSFTHLPTTLVAQVDSSIGGKLGVDLPEGKNLVGVFQQPASVLAHIPFLRSLPERHLIGGLGEVLKYGVIQDRSLFEMVPREIRAIRNRETRLLARIVKKSARIKAFYVEQDERETKGQRRMLNFGHTFGHALEQLTSYRRYHHGEAVAIGMALAARISWRLGFCPESEFQGVAKGIRSVGLPTVPPPYPKSAWLRALKVDKKARDGMIHFVFMKRIGEAAAHPIAPRELLEAL